MDPAKASNPPAYSALDTSDPDGQFATNAGQMIISYCRDAESNLNSLKLRKLMEMVVSYVNKETGVMPSVATTPAANIPPNDNPNIPDEWDWSMWDTTHVPETGTRDMKYGTRKITRRILSANLGKDLDKINAVLEHTLFKTSVKSELPSSTLKYIVNTAQTCDDAIDYIFNHFECKQTFSPSGMIKAAISLGYLPREDIQQLYDMPLEHL